MNVGPPSVLSLCAGVGGLDLGIALAVPGARTICFVENEATAIQRLVARMEDGALRQAPVWSDLKTFDGRPWRGRVDILAAGYPCQPFSCAGRQLGRKDPRHLWPHVARIIRECEPGAVFLENVDAHIRIGYEQVRRELFGLGYPSKEGIFSAEEVGTPHLRKRLFALAFREERGRGELREPSRRYGLPDRRGAQLADAGERFVPLARRGPEARAGLRSAGAPVADAQSADRRPGDPRLAQDPRLGRRRPRGGGSLFPPGKDDFEAWRNLLRTTPALEPALRGGPDGIPARVDRLRLLGNGVVPLVAAFAFVSLARAHQPAELRMAA